MVGGEVQLEGEKTYKAHSPHRQRKAWEAGGSKNTRKNRPEEGRHVRKRGGSAKPRSKDIECVNRRGTQSNGTAGSRTEE